MDGLAPHPNVEILAAFFLDHEIIPESETCGKMSSKGGDRRITETAGRDSAGRLVWLGFWPGDDRGTPRVANAKADEHDRHTGSQAASAKN